MSDPEAWSDRHRALVVAVRPIGYFLFAVLATSLPVMLVVTDVLIVLLGLGAIGTRPALPDPWQILLLAPLLGWFVTLLPPGIAGMGINSWICFVRSLQPRFRTRPIAIIKARSITPILRTPATAVAYFIETTGWLPPLPIIGTALLNGFAVMSLFARLPLVAGALWVAGIVLAVIGVRATWRRWRPKYDRLPAA
jgi:hypothetical protein